MNRSFDNRAIDDQELRGLYSGPHSADDNGDREISLGTPTILAIFFALALALAAVFGLGYSLGRHSAQSSTLYTESNLGATSAPKPSAGTTGDIPTPAPVADTTPPPAAPTETQTQTVPLTPAAAAKGVTPADSIAVGDKLPPAAQPAAAAAASFVVQIAAVSTQDVADILVSSLQKKGYTVAVRHEPQDKLLHVQIGPFPDKKDAEAVRTRVLADGFNAIVK